jgi:hypothetical protein
VFQKRTGNLMQPLLERDVQLVSVGSTKNGPFGKKIFEAGAQSAIVYILLEEMDDQRGSALLAVSSWTEIGGNDLRCSVPGPLW